MKNLVVSCLCLFLVASSALSQQEPQSLQIDPKNPDHLQIEQVLQRYMSAYLRKNMVDLLDVWPELSKEKKEYGKIKGRFEDPNISDEQISLQILGTESAADGALVQAQRTEQYKKAERTSANVIGDLRGGGGQIAQTPGPHVTEKKKDVKKSDTIWIKLRKTGGSWKIGSISEQKPS